MSRQTCHLIRRELERYLDRDLPADRALAVARHLSACPGCAFERDRIQSLRRQLDRLGEAETVAIPSGFASVVMRRLRAVAPALRGVGAGLLLAALACAGVLAASGLRSGAGLFPRVRLGGGESWAATLFEFGRAAFAVIADSVAGRRIAPSGAIGPGLVAAPLHGGILIAACLAALVAAVWLASRTRSSE